MAKISDPIQNKRAEVTLMAVHHRVLTLEEDNRGMKEWRASMEKNTQATLELVEVVRNVTAALKVFVWVGRGLKWIAGAAAAVTAILIAIKKFPV